MDLSLVLISQGIEPTIERSQAEQGWVLLVPVEEHERAVEAIRQYRLENRNWGWQKAMLGPGVLFDWASLAWVLLAGFFYWAQTRVDLQSSGIMDGIAVSHGQWWRLFTAVWLHGDLAHLCSNLAIGFVLLGLAMGHYGTGLALLAAYLAGVGGNIGGWIFNPTAHSLGASGMVMGALGLLAAYSFLWRRNLPRKWKFAAAGIAGGVMLFVLLGLGPGTDVTAHLGGFVFGVVFGAVLRLSPRAGKNTAANSVSGLSFILLVVVPWFLALR
jgi:membrane associated rhomboid family serine protease